MILMWLGSFVMMMVGLISSQKYLASFLEDLQKKFLDKGLDTGLAKMFLRGVDVVVLEASPQKSLYGAMALYNLRVLSAKPAGLVMCLSTLGAWWALILGLLFMSVNGLFILGLCSLLFLSFLITPKVERVLQWIFGIGLFLVGGEMMLKSSSVLQMALGESDFAFFLSDGRFPAVFALLGFAAIVSLIVQVEFWSLLLGLSLLFTNVISLNGVLGLVAGERIGRMLLFWFHTRNLNQDCRRMGWQFSLVSAMGVFLGLFVAGEIKSALGFGFSSGIEAFQNKSLQFVLLFAVILFFQFLVQMIWGHFYGQTVVDELQAPRYISKTWFTEPFASKGMLAWSKDKLHKRLSEIRYHLQGLGSLQQGQVPEHIQARLRTEAEELQKVEAYFQQDQGPKKIS